MHDLPVREDLPQLGKRTRVIRADPGYVLLTRWGIYLSDDEADALAANLTRETNAAREAEKDAIFAAVPKKAAGRISQERSQL